MLRAPQVSQRRHAPPRGHRHGPLRDVHGLDQRGFRLAARPLKRRKTRLGHVYCRAGDRQPRRGWRRVGRREGLARAQRCGDVLPALCSVRVTQSSGVPSAGSWRRRAGPGTLLTDVQSGHARPQEPVHRRVARRAPAGRPRRARDPASRADPAPVPAWPFPGSPPPLECYLHIYVFSVPGLRFFSHISSK